MLPRVHHERDDWDPMHVWRRLKGKPLDFVPSDLPANAPVDNRHGSFMVDATDGARFYWPKGGTGHFSESILRGEATKAMNKRGKARTNAINAVGVGLVWPVALALEVACQGFGQMSQR